jgi:hypothetical protein
LHRFTRDTFAGAACAGPEGPNTPAGHARENLRSTTIQRKRGKDDGNRRREDMEVQRKGVRFGLRAQQTPASASIAAATSDGKSSARRKCVANPRDFQLSRRDLTCWLPALVCRPERPFMAGEHATKDRRGTLPLRQCHESLVPGGSIWVGAGLRCAWRAASERPRTGFS